jgi:hypothetical protein
MWWPPEINGYRIKEREEAYSCSCRIMGIYEKRINGKFHFKVVIEGQKSTIESMKVEKETRSPMAYGKGWPWTP